MSTSSGGGTACAPLRVPGPGVTRFPTRPARRKLSHVNTATDLVLAGTLATVWLTAGLLAETLPTARPARELRRPAGTLCLLIGAGAAVFVAVPVVTGRVPATSSVPAAALLAVAPAAIVLSVTRRRLSQIRR